jgi:chaperone modulatory protein CbpM
MNVDVSEWTWLNDHGVCSAQQLAEASGLSAEELDDLIGNGVIAAVDDSARPKTFHLRYVVTANTARRLRDDFELDRNGMVLALALMCRIDALQGDLIAMQARLDRRTMATCHHGQ